jgi:hypothetical protein
MIAYLLFPPIFSFVGIAYAAYQGHSAFGIFLAYVAFSLVGSIATAGLIYQRAEANERELGA